MTWIIILSVALPIVLVVGILAVLMRGQNKASQLLQTGTPARGRILQIAPTGSSIAVMGHRHLQLQITCEVTQGMAPYTATFTQHISEVQLPSVQPGAFVELRVDPANPSRMAIASVVPPGQPMQQPGGWGQPQGSFGAPIAIGVSQPNVRSAIPFIAIMMVVTTVPTAAILWYVFRSQSNFGFPSGGENKDSPSGPSGGDVCEQAVKCCKVITPQGGACDNYRKMPEAGCRSSLDGFKQSAKALGKSCD